MNVPKLRFPEFSGEWEEKKLGTICESPMYGLNSAGIDFDGVHKYLRITDIDEVTHTYSPEEFTTPSEFDDEYLLHKNDIVFARTGASTGKSYLYNSNDGDLYFAGFLIKFHIKEANSKFVFYQTLTHRYCRWVHIMSTRSGQPGINSEEYSSFNIQLPSIQEQQKIADFLSNVDSIITAETKILNALQKKKKALMQKLFTQQLCFRSDDGTDFPEWEEKKLGECVFFISSGKNKKKKPIGNFPVYGSMGIIGYCEQYVYDKECILVARVGANAGTLHIASGKYDVSDNTLIIDLKENDILNFYYYLLINLNLNKLNYGTGQPLVTSGMLKNLNVQLPCKKEQQKIADCLSSIDSLIQNQQKVVTIWQQRKKALLQQLFI